MDIKVTKTNFFIVSTILFVPLLAMMITWFMTAYIALSIKYYPIDLNDPVTMNQYYAHYQESKDNDLKYKVLVLGLDGILESSLNNSNTPNLMPGYWTSANRFAIPDHWSAANVKAAIRGGTIDWNNRQYQYDDSSFYTTALNQNTSYLSSSIQLQYPNNILAINQEYIEPETLKKINAEDLPWNAISGIRDPIIINVLFLELINAINSNNHLIFGFDALSDEVAHHGWGISTKQYNYSLWIENQYVKALQELLNKRTTEFNEKWLFLLFTDHGRDKAFDGQHHQVDNKSLKAWFYTNQAQDQVEQWINKPIDSNQRGLIDIKSIINGYLSQN